MSCTGTPRLRSRAATTAFPARACQGHTPGPVGDPAADGEIRPAGAHRVGEDGQGRGVEGAVAVQHGHQVGAGVPQSGVDGGAVAAPRLDHHPGAPRAGHRGRVVGRAVVDDEHRPVRQRREHRGQRRGLVEAGEHDLDVHPVEHGPARGRRRPLRFGGGGGAQRIGGERAHALGEPHAGGEAEQRRSRGPGRPPRAARRPPGRRRRRPAPGPRIALASSVGQVADGVRLARADVHRGEAGSGCRRGRGRWPRRRR